MTHRYVTHKILRNVITLPQADRLIALVNNKMSNVERYEVTEDLSGLIVQQDILDLDRLQHVALHDKMWSLAMRANKTWNFDLTRWQQPLRVARYTEGFRHDWHTDYMPDDASKLAFSIPLNEGYEGGEFELLGVDQKIELRPRDAVVFPAFHGHRVKPVTSGVRYVLLGWVTGPRFV